MQLPRIPPSSWLISSIIPRPPYTPMGSVSCSNLVSMEPRLDYRKFNQEPLKALFAMEQYIGGCGLGHQLVHLLKLRASQINGCAYCIEMHSIDARAAGETGQRLYALDAWRETPFFRERERAALGWVET